MTLRRAQQQPTFPGRRRFVLGVMGLMSVALVAKAVDLQVLRRDFLQGQGEARQQRVRSVPAHRGRLLDRRGEPLAVSTPVDSVWADPAVLVEASEHWTKLAQALDMRVSDIEARLDDAAGKQFVYLRRHMIPEDAETVKALGVPGVNLQREYRRYYPTAEVSAHVLGFTDIDDQGQEGLELAYDAWMAGEPGLRRVLQDRLGRVIGDVENVREARPGRDLVLSLDRRIQYLAYRELKAAVAANQAKSGSVVVLDARTGEVLAMANQPAYNPNNRSERSGSRSRNRAVTDQIEPGSTMKPLTLAAALETGRFDPARPIDTTPGWYRVHRHTIRDHRNYGPLDFTGIIQKSSNIGATKVAQAMAPEELWQLYDKVGFGRSSGSGFPGEANGVLPHASSWGPVEQATLSFGYGLSVTPLQLARAYAAIANDGMMPEISFLKRFEPQHGQRVMQARNARSILQMMESVTAPGGTAVHARIAGYRVAGKTGTSHKSQAGGYAEDRYLSVFAGMAPASAPELVCVVIIDEPSAGEYFGGAVAAPVFSGVLGGALRLRGSLPDDLPEDGLHARGAQVSGGRT
jgi:cell division protein FtsI (penicillin-binding protein 3)